MRKLNERKKALEELDKEREQKIKQKHLVNLAKLIV